MSEPAFTTFRLPSGRHRLSREHIAENQRWRLLGATAEAFAEEGYLRMTSHGVARRAGVSSSTFYQQFRGIDDCLLSTFEVSAESLQLNGIFNHEPSFACLFGLELRAAVPTVAEAFDCLVDALAAGIAKRRWGSTVRDRAAVRRLRLWVLAALTLLGSSPWRVTERRDIPSELAELLEACA